MTGPRLTANGVSKCFAGRDGTVVGLNDVDLTLDPGRIVVVVGGPVSGRTTLLRCITGTYRPDAGSVIVRTSDGVVDLATADSRTIAWLRARDFAVFDGTLAAPPRQSAAHAIARAASCHPGAAGAALERLGAGALSEVPVGRLRGPEAATVALAATLAKPAAVVVLDEPDDLAGGDAVDAAVRSWVEERAMDGTAVLAATSPGSAIERTADSTLTIEQGVLRCPTP